MSKKEQDLLKIGELARLAGKTVRAIHLYEEMALLRPAERSVGGFRLYDRDNLDRIRFIDRLQRLGFSLGEIRGVLKSWNGSETAPAAMAALEEVYRAKLAETRGAIRELRSLETELEASLSYLEGCRSCDADADPTAACGTCERPHNVDSSELPLISGLARH